MDYESTEPLVRNVVEKLFQAVGVALDTMMSTALSVDTEAAVQASAAILEFALAFMETFESSDVEEVAVDDSGVER